MPNAIVSHEANGMVATLCVAHRACFLCYKEERRFALPPRHIPGNREDFRIVVRHRFSHTQDQQAAIFWGIDTACWLFYAMC